MRVCLASGGFLSFLVLIQQAQGVPKYRSVGCYRDTQEGRQRPLPRLLADLRPYIEWPDISKTIDKCAALAQTEGYRFFGVQFFGECWSGTNSIDDVTRDGKSNACFQGVGEAFANFVYELPVKAPTPTCGIKPMSRIIGGTTAAPHDWPWQAQILIHVDKSWNHRCGGTLIDTEWVVTAAHCVFQNIEPSNYKIKLGAHDRESSEGALTIPVTAIHMHTRFMTDGSYGYDIAIMKLANPAPIGHTISPACLPGLYDQVTSGTMCYVTGWGMTEYGNAGARLLQQARIPVVSSEECERVNNKHRKVDKVTMLCAGNGGNSSISGCHGDSGGPFVCMGGDGRWVLRGAVSWGDNECKGSTYSVFTRISSFVDWIKCKMTSEPLQRPTECKDAHFYCKEWKTMGWCKYDYFAHMLKGYYCRKTCGACKPASLNNHWPGAHFEG